MRVPKDDRPERHDSVEVPVAVDVVQESGFASLGIEGIGLERSTAPDGRGDSIGEHLPRALDPRSRCRRLSLPVNLDRLHPASPFHDVRTHLLSWKSARPYRSIEAENTEAENTEAENTPP